MFLNPNLGFHSVHPTLSARALYEKHFPSCIFLISLPIEAG